jgi:hypothetical protein
MDVDMADTPQSAPAEQTDKAQEAALTALSECLAQLEETPDNVPLLRRSIGHMKTLGLDAEYLETTQRLSKLIMLDEGASTADLCLSRCRWQCWSWNMKLISQVNGQSTLQSSSNTTSH